MKHIPTIFDAAGKRSPEADWVFAGEGQATYQMDGVAVLVSAHVETQGKSGREITTLTRSRFVDGEIVPLGDTREDRMIREAAGGILPGTYELIGPGINGNPEAWPHLELVPHGSFVPGMGDFPAPARTKKGLQEWFRAHDAKGIVWHHPDGRMAKIRASDLGMTRVGKA